MAGPSPRRALVHRAALVTLTSLCVTTCSSGHNGRGPSLSVLATPTTVVPTTAAPSPPSSSAPSTTRLAAPPIGVGTYMADVVDPTRPTVQYGRTLSSNRSLPTVVRYPAAGVSSSVEVAGATPSPGPWPLVVFAHGYNVTPSTYTHFLHALALAGFVVAAPAFPLETRGGPLDENDLRNEPADISVVISSLLGRSSSRSGVIAHLIDPSRVAVAGHSDGAEAALAVAYVSADARIGPVISMAAQGILGGPHPDPRHPLLVVQGTADTINPPPRGDAVYAAAGRPRFELRLLGGGHLPPVADDTPWRPIVERVSIDFLRRYLTPAGLSAATLTGDGDRIGLATLTADP